MAVTPETIAVALGVAAPALGSATEAQWQMWIDDAQMLIADRAEALGVTDPLSEAKVDYVVREAVTSHVKHPDDATQVSVSVDDANVARTYRSGAGRVRILDEWWTLLGLTPSGGGAFDIDVVSTSTVHAEACSLNFGATYCSCGADIAGFPLWGA